MSRKRRNYTLKFKAKKAKVAIEAIKGDKTTSELAQEYSLRPKQITDWKNQLLENAEDTFTKKPDTKSATENELKDLHAKIALSRLCLNNVYLVWRLAMKI